MEDNKWMIVRKEKISTKIKNYFKNIFSKMLNNQNKKKSKSKGLWPKKHENVQVENKINKEITIEVAPTKKKPKEIVIEYENKPKKKQIVVEYEKKKPQQKREQKNVDVNSRDKIQQEKKSIQIEVKHYPKNIEKKQNQTREVKKIENSRAKVEQPKSRAETKHVETKKVKEAKVEEAKKEPELALKPVKPKKEKKAFNIFQLFKEKERKKRKEILNRVRENKVDQYETISTKTKLSKGSIAVDDVDANELDPLIDLYRDSNKKLLNRIRASQK